MKRNAFRRLVITVAGLAASLVPFSLRASALYEADSSNHSNTIFKFPSAGTKSIFASGVSEPQGLAFDRSGDLFVTTFGNGPLLKFAPNGTRSIFASGLGSPEGLAFDHSNNLFVADELDNTIYKFT